MFNFEHPILGNNKKLRQAMSLAKDVPTMIERFYNGRAIPAHSPIPPGLFGYEKEFRNPYVSYDIPRAGQMLREAGFPGGKGLPEFEYTSLAHTTSRQMAEHFQQDMKAIGIKIKIIGLTWPEFLNKLKTKNFQIAGAAWGADYPDPENFFQLLYGPNEAPGENGANYKNQVYDSLFNKMAVMQDSPERLEIVTRMKNIVVEDCPWIFNTHRLAERLYYRWLGNYKPCAVDPGNFKYLKIDSTARAGMLAKGK
jgi:ABC-type transport system substrate-binding protein